MKKIFLYLVAFNVLISCSKEDDNYVKINGRVQREINEVGIPFQKVFLETYKIEGYGIFENTKVFDSKEVITDENGDFSISMKNDINTFVRVYKAQDDNYSSFELKSFKTTDIIVLNVKKFIKFKILVKNVNPYDNNDFVNVDFYSGLNQNFRTSIQNYGSQNNFSPPDNLPSGGIIGEIQYTSWNGTNVNSLINYNVPENADSFKVIWNKRKNGIDTNGFTSDIPYSIDQINSYTFEY